VHSGDETGVGIDIDANRYLELGKIL